VSRTCQGGYPESSTVGPNSTRRSGSPITLSESSASTRSTLISAGESLDRCDISARVFVRSTIESRPSSAESRSTDRCGISNLPVSLVGVLAADSIEGTCGDRIDKAGCCGPKYDDSFLETALCVAGTYPFKTPKRISNADICNGGSSTNQFVHILTTLEFQYKHTRLIFLPPRPPKPLTQLLLYLHLPASVSHSDVEVIDSSP
jgi:hypothetical protein